MPTGSAIRWPYLRLWSRGRIGPPLAVNLAAAAGSRRLCHPWGKGWYAEYLHIHVAIRRYSSSWVFHLFGSGLFNVCPKQPVPLTTGSSVTKPRITPRIQGYDDNDWTLPPKNLQHGWLVRRHCQSCNIYSLYSRVHVEAHESQISEDVLHIPAFRHRLLLNPFQHLSWPMV